MERQTSSYMKPTRIPFICLAIPLSLILSLWAFSISPSALSATQFPLSTELKSPKPDAFAASSTNPRPKDSVLLKTHVLLTANLSGEAMDFISGGQYSIFNDSYSRRATILSKEGIDLVGEKKNVLSDTKVSPTAATFSASPSTEANISKFANFMSNRSSDSVHEKNTSSVLAEPDAKFCDISDGRWVYDESYPLYSSDACPYMDEGFSCEANGRTDRGYMKWRVDMMLFSTTFS